jgi:prophage antirepressor-like protein
MNKNTSAERENSQLVPFNFENHTVRTVLIDGDPWFIVRDVCDALGIGQPARAIENFPSNEVSKVSLFQNP